MNKLTIIILMLVAPLSANALEFFACEPEWGALIKELAGDDVQITVGTSAFQDPHGIQAKPSLIAAVRNADLVVCSGADLEIGWLPLLLRRSGNPNIQSGGPGYFLAANHVRRLEVPKIIDRSQGDVHPQGNPHIHLNPRNISRVADALAERLAELDPANGAAYQERLLDFQARWDEARDSWQERAANLAGLRLVSYHLDFSYLADWLDLDIVATLEPKPGIPPSGAQLASLLEKLTPNLPAGIIRTQYENEKPAIWLADRLHVSQVALPYTIGGTDEVVDLFSLYDVTLRILEENFR